MNRNSASPNQNQPASAPRISLREALLQQVTPDELADAEAGALANLAAHPGEESPDPRDPSPQAQRNPSRRSSRTEALAAHSPDLSSAAGRHSRKCTICHHEQRAEIEQAFLHWVALREIAFDFQLPTSEAIRRHAIAMGLEELRARTMRFSLHRVIENAGIAPPTPAGVIQAIRACSCLDDNGRWVDPPRHVIVTHELRAIEPAAAQPRVAPLNAQSAPALRASQPLTAASPDARNKRDF